MGMAIFITTSTIPNVQNLLSDCGSVFRGVAMSCDPFIDWNGIALNEYIRTTLCEPVYFKHFVLLTMMTNTAVHRIEAMVMVAKNTQDTVWSSYDVTQDQIHTTRPKRRHSGCCLLLLFLGKLISLT